MHAVLLHELTAESKPRDVCPALGRHGSGMQSFQSFPID